MIDLSAGAPQARYDIDELIERLREQAIVWIPPLFPMCRLEGNQIRCADVTGRPPHDSGSCVIELKGPEAGSFYDHQTEQGGGPLDLLAHATGLWGRDLILRAAELVNLPPEGEATLQRQRRTRRSTEAKDRTLTIANILGECRPVKGTLAETYAQNRNIELPECEDIFFHPWLTDASGKMGWPALIIRPRNPATGELVGGLHRTWIALDGSGKADIPKPKMTLGPISGGVAMLMPMADGRIGIGEGIETSLAAAKLFGAPVWAGLSDSGLAHMPFPEGLRELVIFADRGAAGEKAAATLRDRALAAGIAVEIRLPESDDDFAKDLELKLGKVTPNSGLDNASAPAFNSAGAENPPEPSAKPAGEPFIADAQTPIENPLLSPATLVAGPAVARTFGEILESAKAFTRDTPAAWIAALLRQIIAARLDQLEETQILNILKTKTGQRIASLQTALKNARREIAPAAKTGVPAWATQLVVFESGEPRPSLHNAALVLREAPEWQGVLAFDSFKHRVMLMRPPVYAPQNGVWTPKEWTDQDTRRTAIWLQSSQVGIQAAEQIVNSGAAAVAEQNSFNPLQDYLNSLEWDRKPRDDIWLSYYLGAEDSLLTRAFGSRWLISGVARAFRPGIKADHCLVFEGLTGLKKTTATRIIGDPLDLGWWTDEIAALGSKDASEQLVGIWIVELGEFDAVRRVDDIARVKTFMSRTFDRFRWSYGMNVRDYQRTCIFVATTEETDWNHDPGGARRFWPVRCTAIDIDALIADRHQLWAEAVYRYRQGEKHYLHEDELIAAARTEQADRYDSDPWEKAVLDYVFSRNDVTTAEILRSGLDVKTSDINKVHHMRVATILRFNGWRRFREKTGLRESKYRRQD